MTLALESNRTGRVLFIEDDDDVLTSVRLLLGRHDLEVLTARSPAEGLRLLAATSVDAILLDLNFSRGATSGEEGLRALGDILEQDAQAVVVVVTGHSGINIAVAAMQAGASDFISKPWGNERLVATVRTAVELRRRRRQVSGFRAENSALVRGAFGAQGAILGSSPAIKRLRALIERAAPTDANVLILGEPGTGKDLAARAVHQGSARAGGPLVPVDLSAIPEDQMEAELFGRRADAARGVAERTGRFVAAQGGTLFLDEVTRLGPAMQAKLLAALEGGRITPVGGDRAVPLDARLVAASSLPRDQVYAGAVLSAELLFRLNTVEIVLPPLRERGADVLELGRHFLKLYGKRYGRPDKAISDGAAALLKADAWRGNVRALRHAMERAVILSEGAVYDVKDFPLGGGAAAPEAAGKGDLNLARAEKALIEQALEKHHFNVSHAARDLGLTRAALYRRMEKHGL